MANWTHWSKCSGVYMYWSKWNRDTEILDVSFWLLKCLCRSKVPLGSFIMCSHIGILYLWAILYFAATFPLDLVRRRMQLEGVAGRARVYKSGIVGTFGHIIRSEGFRGLYRGIMPEYYKVVPSVGIVFMTYEILKKLLSNEWPSVHSWWGPLLFHSLPLHIINFWIGF